VASDLRLYEGVHSRRDRGRAAQVASRAFLDDNFFRFLLKNDSQRARALPLLFNAQISHLGPRGRLVTVRDGDAIVGVGAWLSTQGYPQPVPTQLAQLPGTIRALYRHPKRLPVGGAYLKALVKIHPKTPHWYLMLLAVEPSYQRRGVGTMLVEHGLAHVEREGVGVYLETQKEDNLPYYRRFGFELKATVHPIKDGPTYYTMWREAL
jgi:ribosomal protein S18 acetylase RimI-like enzyme